MNNKKTIISYVTLVITLFAMCNICTAETPKPNKKPLILIIDTKFHSFSETDNTKHVYENTKKTEYGGKVSQKINSAKRVFKKITTFKYGKKQKIKAKLGKSSYMLQYSHSL